MPSLRSKPDPRESRSLRAFLGAYADSMKRTRAGWTVSAWSRALGLSHPSSLTKVLDGDRDPGPAMVERFVRYFDFTAEEETLFRRLALSSRKRADPELRRALSASLHAGEMKPLRVRVLDLFRFETLSSWAALPLRELLRFRGLDQSPRKLAQLFRKKIQVDEVSRLLQLLERVGLVEREASGRFKVLDAHIETPSDRPSEAIRAHHRAMLEIAGESLESITPELREFRSLSFPLDQAKVPEAKRLIRDFIDRFEVLCAGDEADSVHQLQVQFFPLTRNLQKSHSIQKGESP